MTRHLLVCITPHGLGHAAQVAPVLNALLERQAVRLTIQSQVPETFLRERIQHPFTYQAHATDFGLRMHSSLDMDLAASADEYRELHRDWERCLQGEVQRLRTLAPDLVLADVPYLPLAAARVLDIPALAMCSLNWADIYRHYFSDRAEAAEVLMQMEGAYAAAQRFLCPQPAMPMPWLANRQEVGPIARLGCDVREELRARLGVMPWERLVLLAPGGVPTDFPVTQWRRDSGVRWIHAAVTTAPHPDVTHLRDLPYGFTDVLRSVDALVGKCGYGTVAECACNGTAMLYIPRPEWPEEAYLLDWLQRHGRCAPVAREAVAQGDIAEVLEKCLALPAPPPPVATGAEAAARIIAEFL